MGIHTALGTDDREPWSYGVVREAASRRAIELRRQVLPHVSNAMHDGLRVTLSR